jgi:hypothetical protein
MMRVLCTVAVLALATTAFAGSAITPQQAMEKTMNCPVCSAWGPEVSQYIRYDIHTTKSGSIETFMCSNETAMDAFAKSAAECEKRAMSIPTMSADDKAKLCPFCTARMGIMGSKDVTMESFKTHMGMVTITTTANPAGQKAIQEYAAAMKAQSDLMEAAAREMHKPETMKGKM